VFGAFNLKISPDVLERLFGNDQIHVSPAGVAFVKKSVRTGLLPIMLQEILDTRILVKSCMKHAQNAEKVSVFWFLAVN